MSNEQWSSGSPTPPPPPGSPVPPPPSAAAPPPPGYQAPPAYGAPGTYPGVNEMSTKPPRPAAPIGAYLALAGAALLIVGSFLTWFTLGDVDVNGFTDDFGDTKDGPVFVTFGVLFIVFGITTLLAKKVLAVAIIAVILAVFAIIAGVADYSDVSDAEDIFGSDQVSAGPGLPVVILGGLLALAGSIVVLAKRRR